ncbi:hypothetical protein OSB04_015601 [Centaurea solstitialis]|uniref:NB-ARC domain-containing protein n=1 Tax=Centaurea solstitialis TaxID=347529 RepID=A0AA38WKA4_9ASTR|nr:hypothetical protein OSB04_015601 [Centaurea solstitialis]
MAYGDLNMYMGYLKQLIHRNDIPFISNNPMILSERPQFQLLYQELDSIIQTLSNIHRHHHHYNPDELEKVTSLEKRFKDVAEEAQDTVDLFLSGLHIRNRGLSPRPDVFKTSLDLEKVMTSIESIKVELMTFNIDNLKIDVSPRIDPRKTKSSSAAAAGAGPSFTRNPFGKKKPLMEEIVVGLDHDVELIRDKLVEDTKQLGIVSIVGMGGLGKTTLATKVFI